MITVISGGEDSLKLIKALRNLLYDNDITVIANTSDALWTQGSLVCPDLDDILYLFSGQLNMQNWTGIKGDTYSTYNFLEKICADAMAIKENATETDDTDGINDVSANLGNIYPIGDKQRAVCIARAMHLKNKLTITQSTRILSKSFGVTATVLPATDTRITAYAKFAGETFSIADFRAIRSTDKTADFKAEIELEFTKYPQITEDTKAALNQSRAVIIGPGSPSTISPILACRHMIKMLKKCFTIAVLPRLPADYIPGRYIALDRLIGTYKGFADIIIQDIKDEFCIPNATRINTDTDSSHKAESLAWEIMSHSGSR